MTMRYPRPFSHGETRPLRRGALALLAVLASCGARSELDLGKRSALASDWDRAVAHYEAAQRRHPENLEVRILLQRARIEASRLHLSRARNYREASELEPAAAEIELAIELDPTNEYAREELGEIRRGIVDKGEGPPPFVLREPIFRGEPALDPASDAPIDLSFAEQTSLRAVLEALAKLAGVNILFDESFRDREVSVELKGVSFRQALELLLETNGLFYKTVSSETVRVGPEEARGSRRLPR
jgi:general secretion pathway protein D